MVSYRTRSLGLKGGVYLYNPRTSWSVKSDCGVESMAPSRMNVRPSISVARSALETLRSSIRNPDNASTVSSPFPLAPKSSGFFAFVFCGRGVVVGGALSGVMRC